MNYSCGFNEDDLQRIIALYHSLARSLWHLRQLAIACSCLLLLTIAFFVRWRCRFCSTLFLRDLLECFDLKLIVKRNINVKMLVDQLTPKCKKHNCCLYWADKRQFFCIFIENAIRIMRYVWLVSAQCQFDDWNAIATAIQLIRIKSIRFE